MTSTTNLSYQEIKEVLSIFFGITEDKMKCWNSQWSFDASPDYIQKKIKENKEKLKADE